MATNIISGYLYSMDDIHMCITSVYANRDGALDAKYKYKKII